MLSTDFIGPEKIFFVLLNHPWTVDNSIIVVCILYDLLVIDLDRTGPRSATSALSRGGLSRGISQVLVYNITRQARSPHKEMPFEVDGQPVDKPLSTYQDIWCSNSNSASSIDSGNTRGHVHVG